MVLEDVADTVLQTAGGLETGLSDAVSEKLAVADVFAITDVMTVWTLAVRGFEGGLTPCGLGPCRGKIGQGKPCGTIPAICNMRSCTGVLE